MRAFPRLTALLLPLAAAALFGGPLAPWACGAPPDEDAAEVDHVAEEIGDAAASNVQPLSIDPDLAIVTAIIFLILLLILWKFAWGPIVEGLQKRESNIANEIAAAEASNKEAHKLLQDYETRLKQAGEEVRAMLDNAKKEAEANKQSVIAEAQAAASAEKDRATREINLAKKAAIDEIAQHSVNLAFNVASEAVKRAIKPDDHRNLIDDALKQFASKN